MNQCPLYTYLVTYTKRHPQLGAVPVSFRTTDDAMQMHRRMLVLRKEAGHVADFTITRIGGAA